MKVEDDYAAYVAELFEGLGAITIKRMFGGKGLHAKGVMFAMIMGETVYLKTDPALAAQMKKEGAKPFVYEGAKGPVTVSYWSLPDSAADDADEATAWARKALAVAMAKKKPAPKKRKAE